MLLLPIFNPTLGMREKLAEKVGRREIYPPVPPPSFYTEEHPLKTLCKVLSLSFFNNAYSYRREIWLHNFFF